MNNLETQNDNLSFRIGLASDHGGFLLKSYLIDFLKTTLHSALDFGCYSLDSVDYPDYIKKLAFALSYNKIDRGIGICRSGIGASIVANKGVKVRAALCLNVEMAKLSRYHNNANVLILASESVDKEVNLEILKTWLTTHFLGERHQRRVEKIHEFEKPY